MNKKGRLGKLIHSLTKTEKRHFKMLATAFSKESNHILLFDHLELLKPGDIAGLKKKLGGAKFSKQLPVAKKYLSDWILRSLRIYHNDLSVDMQLNILMQEIEVLFHKEQFEFAFQKIRKAENLALKFDRNKTALSILGWKRKWITEQLSASERKEAINEVLEQESGLLDSIRRMSGYHWLAHNIMDLYGPESRDFSAEYYENPLVKQLHPESSLQEVVLFHHLGFVSNVVSGKPKKAIETISNLIDVLEAKPERIRDNPSPYITALGNKISILLGSSGAGQIPVLLRKMKEVPSRYRLRNAEGLSTKLRIRTYNIELEMYRDFGDWQAGINLIREIEGYLDSNSPGIPPEYRILFQYQFSYIYFMAGDRQQALTWTNLIASGDYKRIREDIQSYARILNLMIHLELGNVIVLKYGVNSCRRFLRKKRNLLEFEKTLLRFFSKICLAPREEYKYLYRELKSELFEKESGPEVDENVLDYLNFKEWLKNKC